jgi:hypothetical protein
MFGIFGGTDPNANNDDGYESPDDSHYLNTGEHRGKFNPTGQIIGPGVITKWKMNTKAVITDGDNDSSCDIVFDKINNQGQKVWFYQTCEVELGI